MPDQETLRRRGEYLGVPIIPPRAPVPVDKQRGDPNPTVAICGACGLELKRVMSYSCNRSDCPCYVNPTC